MTKNISVPWAVFMVLIGATGKFDLTLIARVPASELLAFGSIPLLWKGQRLGPYMSRCGLVIAILALWGIGVVVSDVVNLNHFERFLRGVMKPMFCGFWCVFFLGVLLKDYRLVMFPALGAVLAAIQNYLMPQAFTAEYLAAGGYEAVAFGVTPIIRSCFAALGIWMYQKHRLYAAFSFFCTAVALGYVGAPRSNVGIALLSAGIIGYIWWTRGAGHKSFRLSLGRLLWMGILGMVGVTVIFYTYQYMASQGWLGEQQLRKYTQQSQETIFGNSPLGILLSGRPQIFGALLGIIDKPIQGYGSWTAWLMSDYFYEAMALVGSDPRILEQLSKGAVAGVGHSIILVAWLENGLLSLIAMLSIYWMMLKVFLSTIQRDSRLTPIIVGAFISFTWAYCFSPFDTGSRKVIGMFFALYVMDFPNMLYQQGAHALRRR
jgi:hypothetical protein